jgi:hypothetical protein
LYHAARHFIAYGKRSDPHVDAPSTSPPELILASHPIPTKIIVLTNMAAFRNGAVTTLDQVAIEAQRGGDEMPEPITEPICQS